MTTHRAGHEGQTGYGGRQPTTAAGKPVVGAPPGKRQKEGEADQGETRWVADQATGEDDEEPAGADFGQGREQRESHHHRQQPPFSPTPKERTHQHGGTQKKAFGIDHSTRCRQ